MERMFICAFGSQEITESITVTSEKCGGRQALKPGEQASEGESGAQIWKPQSPTAMTYFLQQGHSFQTYSDSTTNWGQSI